ncbi:MAG TPA: type 2 isopentenyl-diphosphate Delta-isomerase [Bacteroidales bacterium]|nr:type 2 isopentenyl-diphosphate Delta-isomerase [Bacteroidales bacterium]
MESRKKDHINFTSQSQIDKHLCDSRFYYEPALNAHPNQELPEISFLNKKMKMPVWVSSMTGGTAQAKEINTKLATACQEFGLGMGLGSCRALLENSSRLSDFDMRPIIGDELPFLANLGIAQVEKLIENKELNKLHDMLGKLRVDGLFVHLNPLQEFLQPEGDRFLFPPLETIQRLIEKTEFPIFVKEVGQGMGPESLETLLRLDIAGLEFGAFGGTNFALLELLRSNKVKHNTFSSLTTIGHTAEEMVGFLNALPDELTQNKNIIISGGIGNWLDGYYLMKKYKHQSVFGQASAFLNKAKGDYSELSAYLESIKQGLKMAESYLKIRD